MHLHGEVREAVYGRYLFYPGRYGSHGIPWPDFLHDQGWSNLPACLHRYPVYARLLSFLPCSLQPSCMPGTVLLHPDSYLLPDIRTHFWTDRFRLHHWQVRLQRLLRHRYLHIIWCVFHLQLRLLFPLIPEEVLLLWCLLLSFPAFSLRYLRPDQCRMFLCSRLRLPSFHSILLWYLLRSMPECSWFLQGLQYVSLQIQVWLRMQEVSLCPSGQSHSVQGLLPQRSLVHHRGLHRFRSHLRYLPYVPRYLLHLLLLLWNNHLPSLQTSSQSYLLL